MRLRVVVLGIPGVGKTTVVEKAASRMKGGKLVNFGTVMLNEALKLRWIKHRDELRKLPVEKQKRLQRLAARSISRMKGNMLFVDTHLFIRTPEGFWPGIPFEVARALKPTHLVLVEAKSGDVAARRSRDATRYRDSTTQEELESELTLARSFLTVASSVTGAPMLVLMNEERRVEDTVKRLLDVLKEARA
jgi:adenylate kinase